jgi:isochorismate hydrolase
VVNKTIYGTFNSTGLDHAFARWNRFRRRGRRGDNVCVEATARDAADLGYQVVLLDDGCAALSQEIHEVTLLSFGVYVGRVRRADEVLALLKVGDVALSSSSGPGVVRELRRS